MQQAVLTLAKTQESEAEALFSLAHFLCCAGHLKFFSGFLSETIQYRKHAVVPLQYCGPVFKSCSFVASSLHLVFLAYVLEHEIHPWQTCRASSPKH